MGYHGPRNLWPAIGAIVAGLAVVAFCVGLGVGALLWLLGALP